MKQKTLFKLKDYSSEFGGALQAGRRKTARPLSGKNAIHLVLRADIKTSGSLLKSRNLIEKYFADFALKFNVRIYKQALVSNHIHVTALFANRLSYVRFIRALTSTLAMKLKIKWRLRPWSRIIFWGRAFSRALDYVQRNHLEATQAIPYQGREKDRRRTRELLRALEFGRKKTAGWP